MKQVAWLSVLSTLILSACASPPPLDYSKVDDVCAQKCKADETECATRYAEFPTLKYTHCTPEARACVKACPPPGTTAAAAATAAAAVTSSATSSKNTTNSDTPTDKPSISDRLKQVEELHKNGLINDKEYTDKRQEILKSL